MSELISEIEAFTAWKNGQAVEIYDESMCWHPLLRDHGLCVFDSNGRVKFRLKPRTITINGIEVPAPDHIETNPNLYGGWAINIGSEYYMYKKESDYKIVVAALRSIFGKK